MARRLFRGCCCYYYYTRRIGKIVGAPCLYTMYIFYPPLYNNCSTFSYYYIFYILPLLVPKLKALALNLRLAIYKLYSIAEQPCGSGSAGQCCYSCIDHDLSSDAAHINFLWLYSILYYKGHFSYTAV